MIMTRRHVLRLALTTAGLGVPASRPARADAPPRTLPDATPKHLPRWRGFNLLNKFMAGNQKPFQDRDFADIAELGFDFVRLPMDYRCWTDRDNPRTLKEPVLKEIDHAVELGRKHGVHVQINFHRAPGYTVARPREPKSLWTDPEILDVCARSLGDLRSALPGYPQQLGQLQSVQRARRQGQTRGPPPRCRAHRRLDPRAGRESADRLRRPRLGHAAPRGADRPERGCRVT